LGVAENLIDLPALVGSTAHLFSGSVEHGAADVDVQVQNEQEQSEVFLLSPRHFDRQLQFT